MKADQKDEVAIWCKEFRAMISSGVAILGALAQLEKEARTPRLKEATAAMRTTVAGGRTLSSSMASFHDLFPEPAVRMMELGEKYGIVDIMLGAMSEYALMLGIPGDIKEPGVPAVRIAGMILAEAARTNAREIQLVIDDNGTHLALDGEERPAPPVALFPCVVKAFLRLAGIADLPTSSSAVGQQVKAKLDWDGTRTPCVLESSDITKELTIRRDEG